MAAIVRRVKADGTPSFQVRWRDERREQHSETFNTEAAAIEFRGLVDAAGQRLPDGWISGFGFPDSSEDRPSLTLDSWADRSLAARTRANARTRADYVRDYRRHISPKLGHLLVDSISREDAGRWLNDLADSGLSAKTIRNLHGLASSIMREAVLDGHAARNPFEGLARRLPPVRTEEIVCLDADQFSLLVDEIKPEYRGFVVFLAATGLRWGEATALAVSDVDLRRSLVTVRQAWKRQPDSTFRLGEPKTRRSRRSVSVPESVLADLRHRVEGKTGSELVFTTPGGSPLSNSNFRDRVWRPAIKAAEARGLAVHPRIHDLRHTHVSWLLDEGIDLVRIQRRLGHESIQTSVDLYGHLLPGSDSKILDALDRALPPSLNSNNSL